MKRKDEDLILLNSYLDHELNDSEMLTFAQRLSQDPSLAAELDELIAVKSKFAALRETKAPRKYILTRAEAAQARKPNLLERLFPLFRASVAAAALAIVILTVFPFAGNSPRETVLPFAGEPVELVSKSIDPPDDDVVDYSLESVASGAVSAAIENAAEPTAAEPQYFSSQGVRGGTPKMEVLLLAERKFPDDRTGLGPNGANDPAAVELAEKELNASNQEEIMAAELERAFVPNPKPRPVDTIRKILFGVLAVSLVWTILTLSRRKLPI